MLCIDQAQGAAAMKVSDAVRSRLSVRAFTDQPVEHETLEWMLETAAWTPSGGNLQPWRVWVLENERLEALKTRIGEQLDQFPLGKDAEYHVYPPKLHEPYRSRRFRCGQMLYESIGIERADRPGRVLQYSNNYRFFGAPAAMFFAIDRRMQQGQWSDLGMFIQTLMLLAREKGLDTCAQEAWAKWYEEVVDFLKIPDELMLFCGLAIGYRDASHPINQWRTERAPLDEWVVWDA
jgi:nitroreductase